MSAGTALIALGLMLLVVAVLVTRLSGGYFVEGLSFLFGLFLIFLGAVLSVQESGRMGE